MKVCKVEGCNDKHCGLGYCIKHYRQYKRHGHILEYTRFDLNEIILYDNYAEVILCNKDGEEVARSLIDLEDVELLKNIKWRLCKSGYAYNNKIGFMHRLIMNCPNDMVIDHINGNKLDNRKVNLRICTTAENNRNQNKRRGDYSSQFKGVYWHKKANKWITRIKVNNKTKHIGYYDSELDASIAYDRSAIIYFGVYAKLNHGIDNYIDYIISLGLNPDDFII